MSTKHGGRGSLEPTHTFLPGLSANVRAVFLVRETSDHALMPIFGPVDPLHLAHAFRGAGQSVTRRLRADHLTLNDRSLRSYGGVMAHAYLHAAVAPSRRIRPLDGDAMAEAAASCARFLGLPSMPAMSGAHSQRFETSDSEGASTRSLFVTRSGVLEILWALKQTPTDDASWSVSAVDACGALARFSALVQSDIYGDMLGSSRRARVLHSRVDWSLGVAPTTMSNNGSRGWRDIIVDGPQPDRATNHPYGFIPPGGYGARRLHDVKRTLATREILQTLLAEWLQANGYLRSGSAIERTVEAALTPTSAS